MSSMLYILILIQILFVYYLLYICTAYQQFTLPDRGTLLRAGHASIRRSGCLQKKDAERRLFPRGARGPI